MLKNSCNNKKNINEELFLRIEDKIIYKNFGQVNQASFLPNWIFNVFEIWVFLDQMLYISLFLHSYTFYLLKR